MESDALLCPLSSSWPCRGLGSAAETVSRGPWVPSGHAQKVHAVPAPLVAAAGLGSGVSAPDKLFVVGQLIYASAARMDE